MEYHEESGRILFPEPLIQGRIIDRPNRFIVNLDLEGETVRAHCPSTGKIGGLVLDGLPCLASKAPVGGARSTTHTMEAIAVEEPGTEKFQWIGINQTAVNRYIEVALRSGLLDGIPNVRGKLPIKREPKLGSSRLDFLLGEDTYIEVKTPIKNLQVDMPASITIQDKNATGTSRMLRQVNDIMDAIAEGKKALLFTVFLYNNPGFKVPKAHNKIYSETVATMEAARLAGMERWQINFEVDPTGVKLTKILEL